MDEELDKCVSRILRLEQEGDDAVRRSVVAANDFLMRIPSAIAAVHWRERLVYQLDQKGPLTLLMREIVVAVERGSDKPARSIYCQHVQMNCCPSRSALRTGEKRQKAVFG